ncbi:MAG: hypothetical protein KGJ13_10555 [Patescibacteria group bacterium]|nr:hypothetical protein [Patescibacteria group bacterium]
MISIAHEASAMGGDIVIQRQFFNPQTGYYLSIEAHEEEQEGRFSVAFFTQDGNDGDRGFSGSLRHVVECMQDFTPDNGLIEMPIPPEVLN